MVARRYRTIGLCLWPGLPQIWSGQVVTGLLAATFFGLMLNAFVVTQWVYTDWTDPGTRQILMVMAATFYLAMTGWTCLWVWKFHPEKFEQEIERLYRLAADSYLKGRWAETRDQLERIVALDPSDAEALLRLARLLQRNNEKELAVRVLDQCRDTPGALKWRWEIEQMSERLHRGSDSLKPQIT